MNTYNMHMNMNTYNMNTLDEVFGLQLVAVAPDAQPEQQRAEHVRLVVEEQLEVERAREQLVQQPEALGVRVDLDRAVGPVAQRLERRKPSDGALLGEARGKAPSPFTELLVELLLRDRSLLEEDASELLLLRHGQSEDRC